MLRVLTLMFFLAFIASCSDEIQSRVSSQFDAPSAAPELAVAKMQGRTASAMQAGDMQAGDMQANDMQDSTSTNERSKYLAYEHNIRIDLDKDLIATVFDQINKSCKADQKYQCTLLQSNLNKGDYPSAYVRLRIQPKGVDTIVDAAAASGEVTSKGVNIDDLQSAIVDGDKRLEMHQQYLARLKVLESQSAKDIESLIKIASEMSRVQSDIEYTAGEKARLLQRVQMDIVNISLQEKTYSSFWQPISDAFKDFGKTLSKAVALVIKGIAYLLPWIFVLIIFAFIFRAVRRKLKH